MKKSVMPNLHNMNQKLLTRQSIIEGLAGLMKVKPIERIRISELCTKAGVSRVAFYRHFDNLQDALKGYFADQQAEFLARLRKEASIDLRIIGLRFLQFVEQEKVIFKEIFRANLQWILGDYVVSGIEIFRNEFLPTAHGSQLEKEYMIAYEAGGLLSIVAKWLGRDCRDSKEEVLQFFLKSEPGFDADSQWL